MEIEKNGIKITQMKMATSIWLIRIFKDGKPLTRFTLHEEMTKPQLQKLLKVYEPAKN